MKFSGFSKFQNWWDEPSWKLVEFGELEAECHFNISGVYVFVDTRNKKPVYIGQSENLNRRIKSHNRLEKILNHQPSISIEIRVIETGKRHDVAQLIEAYCINRFLLRFGRLPKYNRKI